MKMNISINFSDEDISKIYSSITDFNRARAQEKYNIAVDLDNTILYKKNSKFILMRNVEKYLPLIAKKYNLILISARRGGLKTRKQIIEIEEKLNIKFIEKIFTAGKELKSEYAKIHNCKYLIDDLIKNLEDCSKNSVIPILIGDPDIVNGDINICSNWKEIYNLLKN